MDSAVGGLVALSSALPGPIGIGAGMFLNRQQQKSDLAQLKLESEQARLAATDQARTQAQGFRRALASQLALGALRGGSLQRQFGAVSIGNFLKDQKVIDKKIDFINMAESTQRANIRSNRFSSDVNLISTAIKDGINMVNFSG